MQRFFFIVLLASLCSFQTQDRNPTDEIVMKAAEAQLPVFLDRMQPGTAAGYGFTDYDDLDRCEVGKPFRMMVFNSDFYSPGQINEERNYIIIKNEWRVPVSIKDTSRTLLTVDGNPGNYTVSAMGTPLLAQELQKKTKGMDDGSTFYLLQVPTLLADFLATEHDKSFTEAQFIPLQSALIAIPELAQKPAYTLVELEQIIKKALAGTPTRSGK